MMHRRIENKHIVDTLFVLTLFAVFAICSMLLIAFGANIYQRTVQNYEEHFNINTSIAYISEKIRQSDDSGAIDIIDFGDTQSFRILSTYNDIDYYTYIYLDNGYLKELFAKADNDLGPKAGKKLLPIKRFNISRTVDGKFICTITDIYNSTMSVNVSSKCDPSTHDEVIAENN